ncbi:MAG: hypothetical protein FVQ80_12820 [Planctomycetes bacterium]|nr:hypothetical protein [Planctomycetota bacterium]
MECKDNPFVAIAAVCGGMMVASVAIILIFAKDAAWVAAPIAASLAVMGIFLGYFASKKNQ